MPSICLIAGALFINACAKWCQIQENQIESKSTKPQKSTQIKKHKPKPKDLSNYGFQMAAKYKEDLQKSKPMDPNSVNLISILCAFLCAHLCGVLIMNSPRLLVTLGSYSDYSAESSLFYGFIGVSVIMLIFPYFIPFKDCEKSMSVLNILCLLELGTALICISMNNFSLGLFCSVIYVPPALSIGVTQCSMCSLFKKVVWVFAHPVVVLILTVQIYTALIFMSDSFEENFYRGIGATKQAIVFSIVDSMIYGNWLFSVATSIFVSNWLCFWIVAFAGLGKDKPKSKID